MRPPESFIGQPIRSLQTMLRVIAEDTPGMYALIPDGIYGPETVRAIAGFQQQHGLPVTGVTDQTTWETIVLLYEEALTEQDEAQPLYIVLDPGQVIRKGERHPTELWDEYGRMGRADGVDLNAGHALPHQLGGPLHPLLGGVLQAHGDGSEVVGRLQIFGTHCLNMVDLSLVVE